MNKIYEVVSKLFNGITIFKISDNIESGVSIYKANVSSLLCSEFRYIIIVSDLDYNQIGTTIPLNGLKWKSFQTRCSNTEQSGGVQQYTTILSNELKSSIKKINFDVKGSNVIYKCDQFPNLKIELLSKTRKMSTYEETLGKLDNDSYANVGTLQSALNTFYCVLSW